MFRLFVDAVVPVGFDEFICGKLFGSMIVVVFCAFFCLGSFLTRLFLRMKGTQ